MILKKRRLFVYLQKNDNMRTITINELQNNFNFNVNSIKNNQFILVTNKDVAVGLFSSLSDDLFNQGFLQWIGLQSYQNGDLTLRQLAGLLKTTVDDAIKMLNNLNIPVIDYNFDDDLETLKKL
jgi:hypothetical protein